MPVHGLGDARSLGWATITFFLPARDSQGEHVMLECTQDFHILPHFAPQLCLGLDFIQAQGVQIDVRNGRATVGRYTFSVHEKMPSPFASEAEICAKATCFLRPQTMSWVPVDVACLAPGVDYTLHPRLSVTPDETVQLAGPVALATNRTSHVLLANYGSAGIHIARRTPVADALAAHLGDASGSEAHSFGLPPPLPPGAVLHTMGTSESWSAASGQNYVLDDISPAAPPDLHDEAPEPSSSLMVDAATKVVDGHYKVGVNSAGEPHPEVVDLLRRHEGAFALDGRPGLVRDEEMAIPLVPGAIPHAEPPRRASPEKKAAMDAALDQLLEWDVVEPSSSPASFPVLMVRQNTKWRFCVDYRQLNQVTVADRYPLPTTDAVFNTLLGKRWFSSLDAIRGYHQLPVKEEDRWKTAFICHRGLFQYKAVPFGLRNAPAVFQRLMDKLLGQLRWKEAVVYIDDVVVGTVTLEEHLSALETLLSRATAIGLRFSPSKCTFAVPSLVLLGRKVSGAGVAIWDERAKAVQDLPRPRTLQELYHALGLFGYYRAFIPKFAQLAEPLSRLTRGWRYDRVEGRTRLVDASGDPSSAAKIQLDWTAEQDRSFEQLKSAIANPPVLAHPDSSRPYILYVDASKTAYAAILHQVFATFEPTIATLFPLLPTPDVPVDRARWTAWLRADPMFGRILRDTSGADGDWVFQDGLLVRRSDGKLALPESAVPQLLRALHDGRGHFGFTKTYLALSRHFWRPKLVESVLAWIRHCSVCRRTKMGRRVGELDVENDATLPFDWVAVDLILGFPRSRSGKDALLVILDVFSRMVLLHPCSSSIDAVGIAGVISDRVLRYGWRPRRIISDSEAKMTGSVMQALATSLGAVLTPSPPHHQQASVVERSVQTIQQVLKALCVDGHAFWDTRIIPAVELAINSTPNVTTGYRPFDLVFVSHPDVVHAVFDTSDHAGVGAFGERLAAAAARLQAAHEAVDVARRQQKDRYDRRRAPLPQLAEGDQVYIRLPDRPVAGVPTHKLASKKLGPFSVRRVISPHRVELDLPPDMEIGSEFSVDQLDVLPSSPDPFASTRTPVAVDPSGAGNVSGADANDVLAEDVASETRSEAESLPPRSRLPPVRLADFDLGVVDASLAIPSEMLQGPVFRPKVVEADGRQITLVERPIAFLSRLTTPAEKRLVAPELELSCLAWAFGQWAHLLEGAPVLVITDHAPMAAMLTSTSSTRYGPTITKCRALLLPHLQNLRFEHRPGRSHTNVDSLSRLIAPEAIDDAVGPSSSVG